MSMPSVDVFHHPRSVAVIGASDDTEKIGGRPLRYMRECGFAGRVLPVNPGRHLVQGLPAWPDVRSLPEVPDVAIVAVAGARAVEAVTACAEIGVRGCVVMASGFGETAEAEGQRRQDEMVTAARAAGMRVVGPNSQGLATFSSGAVLAFSTMFTEQPPQDGPVAIISQSGAMCSVPYGLLRRRGIGVRYAHGTGNDADVTVGELAEAVVADPDIRLLLLYLENIAAPGSIEQAAAAALRAGVPVVALIGGRSADGQRAAASHTGALASEQRVVDAFFRRAGIWRARSTTELVAAVELYLQDWPGTGTGTDAGAGLAVVSNSGAVCVLAADAAADHGLPLARLSGATVESLSSVLPRFATKVNPIDVTAALLTDSSLFGKVLPALADDPAVAACFLGLPVSGRGYDSARFAADAHSFATARRRPIVVASPQPDVAAEFRRQGLVVFDEEAAALGALAQYLRHRDLMAAARGRQPTARRTVPPRTRMLNENDSLDLLADLGLPVVARRLCGDPAAAAAAFDDLGGGPVVVKGCTADASHKSELGLVRLGLADRASVRSAAADVLRRMSDAGLRADGVLVAPLVPAVHEALLGAHVDPVFGPVVVVGAGGKYTEALPDVQLLLPPFGPDEVRAAIARLRIAPLLDGVRGDPPADVDGWVRAAVRLGDAMAGPRADIVSLDANPLILTARDAAGPGSVIVDAVVLVSDR
jgi:acyl-CoA synthetase (NDP forming)